MAREICRKIVALVIKAAELARSVGIHKGTSKNHVFARSVTCHVFRLT